jgi:hypothetical protein
MPMMSDFIDYRAKEHRRAGFVKYFMWEVVFNDVDTATWLCNYINNALEYDTEKRFWFAWLYGTTYHAAAAWVILNAFPNFHEININEMIQWNSENYKRLRYQTDTKYNKGFLPPMYASYKRFIGDGTQQKMFESLYADNEEKTFNIIWTAVNMNIHKFGRMMTWIYLQQLKHTCAVPLEPTSMFLRDYGGSRHHRNGLLLALGMEDLIDKRLSEKQYAALEYEAQKIIHETRERFPAHAYKADLFCLESALCGYKKMWRANDSRYFGYALDRQAEEITQVQNDGWSGIDWSLLWRAREDVIDARLTPNKVILKDRFTWFVNHGYMGREEWLQDK